MLCVYTKLEKNWIGVQKIHELASLALLPLSIFASGTVACRNGHRDGRTLYVYLIITSKISHRLRLRPIFLLLLSMIFSCCSEISFYSTTDLLTRRLEMGFGVRGHCQLA